MPIQLACNNRAEQDWQDARSERPARWPGRPRAAAPQDL